MCGDVMVPARRAFELTCRPRAGTDELDVLVDSCSRLVHLVTLFRLADAAGLDHLVHDRSSKSRPDGSAGADQQAQPAFYASANPS